MGKVIGCSAALASTDTTPITQMVRQSLNNMVYVQGGEYRMGDYVWEYVEDGIKGSSYWSSAKDNKPAHKVKLDSFYISKYEVTYAQYDTYTDYYHLDKVNDDAAKHPFTIKYRQPTTKPVSADWYRAQHFCHWLGQASGLTIDLATEAQWEYAARSRGKYVGYATDTGYYKEGVNFYDYLQDKYNYPEGKYPPNPLGIYSMADNASEWCRTGTIPTITNTPPSTIPKGRQPGR